MNFNRALLALSISASLLSLSACKQQSDVAANPNAVAITTTPADSTNETADQFIERVNNEIRADYPEITAAQWLASTNIGGDSEIVSSKANERSLAKLSVYIAKAKTYKETDSMTPETKRALQLLKLGVTLPPPNDPKQLAELTQLATKLDGMYGSGKYCTDQKNDKTCKDIGQLSKILADTDKSTYEQQLDAWNGWHTISKPMRAPYQRFIELSNIGAKDLGFANTGDLWRGGYDMPAADFQAETDRLWGQFEPLYKQLQ